MNWFRNLVLSKMGIGTKEEKIEKNPYKEPRFVVKYNRFTVNFVKESVKWVQWVLVQANYNLLIDGRFGLKTLDAIRRYQLSNGLVPDGMVGIKTASKFKEK